MNNRRWAVILAFCGVFLAGAVVGGLVARRGFGPKHPPPQHSGGSRLDSFKPAVMKRYTARLELDDAQRERLREIVHRAESELRELRGNTFQETIAIGDRMNEQVEHLLRADQLERFAALKRDVQKYWDRERERREQTARHGEKEKHPGEKEKRDHKSDSGHPEKETRKKK